MNNNETRGPSYNPQPISSPIQDQDIDEEVLTTIVTKVFEQLQDSHLNSIAQRTSTVDRIPVGISVRHLHICQSDLDKLFGPGFKLTPYKDLYQPGTFAANETVAIIGPKRRMLANVRILAPLRDYTQLELARTDAIFLGIDAPLRNSGDIKGSAPFIVVGPKGVLDFSEGAIRARRHIHMNPREAETLGVKHGQVVKVRISGECGVTFDNVLSNVKDGFRIEVHLDTDEGNVADISKNPDVEIIV